MQFAGNNKRLLVLQCTVVTMCVAPVTIYHQTLQFSPSVLKSGHPVRMVITSQNNLYHISAESTVVSLQKLREHLGQQCGLPSQRHEHRRFQAGPGLQLSVHTWRIAIARHAGKTLRPHEQAKDAASTSSLLDCALTVVFRGLCRATVLHVTSAQEQL